MFASFEGEAPPSLCFMHVQYRCGTHGGLSGFVCMYLNTMCLAFWLSMALDSLYHLGVWGCRQYSKNTSLQEGREIRGDVWKISVMLRHSWRGWVEKASDFVSASEWSSN